MALENGTYVKDLVITNPSGTDAISQGDDHIRLIKTVLKNTFPSTYSGALIPDISGNGDKYLQVNSGATGVQWSVLDVNALTERKGMVVRSHFSSSGGTLTCGPGVYHMGGKNYNVEWDSPINVTGFSGTGWRYIYLDHSVIGSATTVTSGDIIQSSTVPTYTNGYHGWYNGMDRCIFAVYCTSSGTIDKFYHDGSEHVQFDTSYDIIDHNPPTRNAWVSVPIPTVPAFSMTADLMMAMESDYGSALNTSWWWRTTGSSAPVGDVPGSAHYAGKTECSNTNLDEDDITVNLRAYVATSPTDTTKSIDYYADCDAANQRIQIQNYGFYLPTGL